MVSRSGYAQNLIIRVIIDVLGNPSSLGCEYRRRSGPIGAEEVYAEAVNPRAAALKNTEAALRSAGFAAQADAVGAIRREVNWSHYVVKVVRNVQKAMRRHKMINRLRYLLYPAKLTLRDRQAIEKDQAGIVWL